MNQDEAWDAALEEWETLPGEGRLRASDREREDWLANRTGEILRDAEMDSWDRAYEEWRERQ